MGFRIHFVLIGLLFISRIASAQVTMSFADALEHARIQGPIKVMLTSESAEPIAMNMRRPGTRIFAEVSPIGELEEPGCRRLQVRITSPGSQLELKDGGTRDLDESFSLGMCANGTAPKNPFQFAAGQGQARPR
ncbi:MAG: hypothetical protein KGZ68_17290 [Dechloromonas sp.]|nr:hypothetical protein [Dechloromonas sp.]